jgi:hypothetical protein
MAIIVTRPISIDEEICIDYTEGLANVSKITERSKRQETLKSELDFDCSCTKCNEDQMIESWENVEVD